MKKVISLILVLPLLTGCLGGGSDASVEAGVISEDYVPQLEQGFTINVKKGYEVLSPSEVNLILPEDYVMGYGEVRLDSDYATTFTIHREDLPYSDIASLTYTQALADNAQNVTDYTQESFEAQKVADRDTAVNKFTYSVPKYAGKVRAYQTGVVKNGDAWVLTCSTRAEGGDDKVCEDMLGTFYLR